MNEKLHSDKVDKSAGRRALLMALTLGAVWFGMTAGDWYFRFSHFRWHDMWVIQNRAIVNRGPEEPMLERTVGAHAGGDLTALTGITAFNQLFEEARPEIEFFTDEAGYRNVPPTNDKYYPVVVVGDSFMYQGYPTEMRYDHQLSDRIGVEIYNHSYPGRGPFWALSRFVIEGRFKDRMPKVLVWGFIERDVSGSAFDGMVYQLWRNENPEDASTLEPDPEGIAWSKLKPAGLKTELPNTSLIGAMSKRTWNRLRYAVFQQITDDVQVSKPLPSGNDTLFYRLALESMEWPPEVRKTKRVIWCIEYIRDYLREQGTELVLLMIPNKEQVYREYIPESIEKKYGPFRVSVLDEVSEAIQAKGIPHINLLPVYREAALKNVDLYWRDDTHWQSGAITLAVDATEPILNGLLLSGEKNSTIEK